MISTNRIFESAHGPEIPNFLEIVAGLYSIGLPRRLVLQRRFDKQAAKHHGFECLIPGVTSMTL
jgi:hypothetical protein